MEPMRNRPSNGTRSVPGEEQTVTLTVENDREIRIPRDLLHLSASQGPLMRDAWETGFWDRTGFHPGQ
jgi:hypothetical protein